MNTQPIIVAGIDVSKTHLDVDLAPASQPKRFAYNPKAIARLVAFLKHHRVKLVVLEATGGLEQPLAAALAQADLIFHIANPRRVRDFARATQRLAKTDRIDANVLAWFGIKIEPRPSVLPCETRRKLAAAVMRDQQLQQTRVAENNRLKQNRDPDMQPLIEQSIAFIDQQIAQVRGHIDKLVADDQAFAKPVAVVESVPGMGRLTAARLVTLLPELGHCNRGEIAMLIGVAPINRDSGKLRGKRTTGGGRRIVRQMLYMPTLVAMTHNPVIRQTYEGLIARGKPKMVAVVAAMRKLIILINAMLREDKTWSQLNAVT